MDQVLQDFVNKTVVITGSGSGLGRSAAMIFAQRGANVVVSDRQPEGMNETLRMIQEIGGKAIAVPCDVTDENQVNNLFAEAQKTFGTVDVAVNNAGIGGIWTHTHAYPTDNFKLVMDVNTLGVFYGLRAALQIMIKQGSGNIINISSVAGLSGFPNNVAYSASKHAVIGITRSAALEYSKKGIRVNAVCPVFTLTPMVEDMLGVVGDDMGQKLINSIPMKRLGKASEIADVIVWLASDASSFVTGVAMPVDGGMTAS
jgi:NAD(P)-dependent dehydrogenase (short-subunit alcohol dehydrogenase family)